MSIRVTRPIVNPAYDRDLGQAGMLAPVNSISTVNPTANLAYLLRFVPSRNMTITKIAFAVITAAGSDDNVDVGIYNSDLSTKLVSTGDTAGLVNATTGTKTATVASTSLVAGTIYYVAFAYGTVGSTVATLASAYLATTGVSTIFGSSPPQLLQGTKTASHPLPSSIATPTSVANSPLLALRES